MVIFNADPIKIHTIASHKIILTQFYPCLLPFFDTPKSTMKCAGWER